jgi:hypothetical protein
MLLDFDLQIFAEDEIVPQEAPNAESTPEPQQEVVEEKPSIPDELVGLDESIAREVMAEAEKKEEPKQDEPPADKGAPSPVPYTRFKEKVDEVARLKEELEKLKSATPQGQPVQQATPEKPQEAPPAQPGIQLTDENMKLLSDAVKQEAIRMSGLTEEDLDSLDYMEDDDPRKQKWQYAQEFAKSNVMDKIRRAQAVQIEQAQMARVNMDAAIADYNNYAQAEMQEPDFANVTQYATGEFFAALPPAQQAAVTGAYARVERNTASIQDIYLVKNYFQNAKAAYHAKSGAPAKKVSKAAQATRFPRSTQIQGAGGSGGGVTEGQLRKMLDEMPWNDIPKEYQEMLLGMK